MGSNGQPIYPNGVPGSTVSAQASYLVANDFSRWVDFTSTGYSKFYAALANRLGAATGRTGLVIDQCGANPSMRRLYATDERIVATVMSPKSYLCNWDDQLIQLGRSGPILTPPIQEVAGAVAAAAREPLIRNGANIEADDAAYWSAIASFYPTLSASAQKEVGYKLLKRLWIWQSWAHIADRSGDVRRALAFVSRDYWDAGSLTALNPLTSLIQSIVPTKPFGPAIYYSVAAERAVEQAAIKTVGPSVNLPVETTLYMNRPELQTFLDGGSASGYYVSDAALPAIKAKSANAPSAWLPGNPITVSNGLTAFGFYDQTGRLIIVISNPSAAPGATSVTGTIAVANTGLSDGSHKVTSLLDGATYSVGFSKGAAAVSYTVGRWDTVVFAVNP